MNTPSSVERRARKRSGTIGKSMKLAAAVAAAVMGAAGTLEAAPIQFTFDCIVVNATVCTPGGPYGTLTLTDSAFDSNRVDLNLVVYPHAGVDQLNSFFINTSTVPPPFYVWRLVDPTAPAGSFNTNLSGSVGYTEDGRGPGIMFTFDLQPNPDSTLLTYSGSLLLASSQSGHAEFNLDPGMFNVKDENGQLYAAFNTLPNGTSLNAGALSSVDLAAVGPEASVPEPGVLVLMLTGLASLGFGLSRPSKTSA